jgi:ribokinase
VRAGGARHFDAPRVNAVDATGAGDAFNAGLVTGLAEGMSMEESIDMGIRAGAFCVTRLGVIAGLPTRAELEGM